MVTSYQTQHKQPEEEVQMDPERSKLHNMMLPPPSLTWVNNSKPVWCMKKKKKEKFIAGNIESTVQTSYSSAVIGRGTESESESESKRRTKYSEKAPSPAVRSGDSGSRSIAVDDGGIGAEREKIMSDFKSAANEMQLAFMKEYCSNEVVPKPAVQLDASSSRPWNLRSKKREASKSPDDETKERKSIDGEKKRKKRFSICLSHGEIEEDYLAMVGHLPPKRPKKRSKIVQKELDDRFPGLGLTQVTAGKYKVPGPRKF